MNALFFSRRLLVLAAVGAAIAAIACNDPVLDDAVSSLGDEVSGIPTGEFHRPGQDCQLCHQEGGKASGSVFTVAGTVFAQPSRDVGVDSVEVRLTDSDGTKFIAKTNCVGNFFVTGAQWSPKFPILVAINKNGSQRNMSSVIGRSAGCAQCHKLAVTDKLQQEPHIYLFGTDESGSPDGDLTCPTSAIRPGTK